MQQVAASLLSIFLCGWCCAQAPIEPPPAGYYYHGVYPGGVTGEEDDITPAGVASYESHAGKRVAWVYFSHNWYRDRSFPLATASWISASGSVPFVRLMLRDSARQDRRNHVFTLKRLLKGVFDEDLRAWARSARDFSAPLIAEFGTEVNGRWFPWNGRWNGRGRKKGYGDPTEPNGPERFRDAYRHIVDLARSEGATNVLWVFHVNNEDWPAVSWNRFENYYPGDDYIDWLGVSVYGAQTPREDAWPLFRPLMDAVYPRLAALSSNKPVALLEFGACRNNPLGDQAAWADAALSDILASRWPRLLGFSWWNEWWQNDNNPAHDTTMRLEDNPALSNVFRTLVGGSTNVLEDLIR
ncbi:beta-mannanase [bacterium]|nr:beta-mannanase [bacterium]